MKILNQSESKAALAAGKCDNGNCATPGAMDLPDGHRDAERVMLGRKRKTGETTYSICAPWLFSGVAGGAR